MNTPTYRGKHKVLNPSTGRYVLKTGKIGKSLRKTKCSFKSHKTKKTCRKSKKTMKKTTKKTVRKSPKKVVKKSSPKKTIRKSSTGSKYKSASGRVYTKCWSGYKRSGWKMKNGRRVPNCVKA